MNNVILMGAVLAFTSIIFGGTDSNMVNDTAHLIICKVSRSPPFRLGPFYGAIAVPSVTRWRCRRRCCYCCCGHWRAGRLAVANGPNIFQMLLVLNRRLNTTSLHCKKNIRLSADIFLRVFHILTKPVPYTFVSVNRRNIAIWKIRPKISVDIQIFFTV